MDTYLLFELGELLGGFGNVLAEVVHLGANLCMVKVLVAMGEAESEGAR